MKRSFILTLFTVGLIGGALGGCAGGYVGVDDDGPAYADPGFYGGAWYDDGPYYGAVPYGRGSYDKDHKWHATETHPGAGGGGHPTPVEHNAPGPRPVPSVPNAPRPSGVDRVAAVAANAKNDSSKKSGSIAAFFYRSFPAVAARFRLSAAPL